MKRVGLLVEDRRNFQDPDGEMTSEELVSMMVHHGLFHEFKAHEPTIKRVQVMIDCCLIPEETARLAAQAVRSADPATALAACRRLVEALNLDNKSQAGLVSAS